MHLKAYTPSLASLWNDFVAQAKNGTFMLDRRYMDYHSQRFEDCSLLFMEKERVFAVLPANIVRSEATIYSHLGLTYGGLVMGSEINAVRVMEAFELARQYYASTFGARRFIYKSLPYIYHRQASGEDEYALFRCGARLVACGLSSTVNLQNPIAYERSRRNALKKAKKMGLRVEPSDDYTTYWTVLNEVLSRRHGLTPVHTAAELELLAGRFPEHIRLYVVRNNNGHITAGTYIFIYDNVVHTQYMTATDEARHTGALDLLVDFLINLFRPTHQWLDFGISTEKRGLWLNEGLIYQKEGFGGRGVCYNQYELSLIHQ